MRFINHDGEDYFFVSPMSALTGHGCDEIAFTCKDINELLKQPDSVIREKLQHFTTRYLPVNKS